MPLLECVVFRGAAPDIAVWGYSNPAAFSVTVPFGSSNGFSPAPLIRGQPRVFDPGRLVGEFQTPFAGRRHADVEARQQDRHRVQQFQPLHGQPRAEKSDRPGQRPGRFNLRINRASVITGPNGTTTGPLTVGVGEGTVSETAGPGTSLADYSSRVDCTRNGQPARLGPRHEGGRRRRERRRGRLHVHEHAHCAAAHAAAARSSDPAASDRPADPGAAARADGRPRRAQDGHADDRGARAEDHVPDHGHEPLARRRRRRECRSRLRALLPAARALPHPVTGELHDRIRATSAGSRRARSATITVVAQARVVGRVLNVVSVSSEEQETDYLNNTASALVRITDPPSEAKKAEVKAAAATLACHTLTVGAARPASRRDVDRARDRPQPLRQAAARVAGDRRRKRRARPRTHRSSRGSHTSP